MDKQKNYKLILHILITVICVSVFYYITVRTKPYPFSDFLYYWNYATDLSQYYKGGLLFLLYAPLKFLDIQPYIAAFIVNSLCFIALSYSMWLGRKSKLQIVSSILLALVGIWFLGFIPIVNTDIPTISLFILGIAFFFRYLHSKKTILIVLSMLSLTFSLSMRSQLFFICIFFILIIIGIFIFQYIKKLKFNKILKLVLLILAVSTISSFTVTKYLEVQTTNTTELAIHKRLTFYTGLFDSTSIGEWCGSWSSEAVKHSQNEMNLPLKAVLIQNLQKMSLKQITDIIQCKWENYIFVYNESGLKWLEGHMTNGWTTTKEFGNYWNSLKYIEYFSVQIIKLTSFFLVFLFIYDIKKFSKSEIFIFGLTVFTVLMFFAIHTILEIQARYIISPVIISLIFPLYLHSRAFKILTN